MKKSFAEYQLKTKRTFEDVQKAFQKVDSCYVPTLHISNADSFVDSPKKIQEVNNKQFLNKQNVYLRFISTMKQFLLSQEKDFIIFLKRSIQLKVLDKLFTKIQLQKNKCPQFHVLIYIIWTNNRKLIRTYIKFRDQILQKCTFDKVKNIAICLHNQSKYSKQQIFIGGIQVEFEICQFMIQYFKSQIPFQMIQWLGKGKKYVESLKLLLVFLWQNQNKELVHLISSQMEHQN